MLRAARLGRYKSGRVAAPCPGIKRLNGGPPKITLPNASTATIFVARLFSRMYSAQPLSVPHVLAAQKR
jgi:hypothetical protein